MSNPAHGSKTKGKSKILRGSSSTRAEEADWGQVEILAIGRLVQAVGACGCAVLFGSTSDGGALSLVFFDGSEKEKSYCGGNTDATDWVLEHAAYFEGVAKTLSK